MVHFCDDPKKNIHKTFIPQKILIFRKTPKNIEIQNFEPQRMTRAYVCMKISEYPPPLPPGHGRDNLDTPLQEANSFHSTIRFTAEVSNDKHVLLDTQSRLDDDRICTDLFMYIYWRTLETHHLLKC